MTSRDKSNKDIAIKQINDRFIKSKAVNVGMVKNQDNPDIIATKVIDFLPFLQILPNKMTLVTCDDNIEDELISKKPEFNDFLLYKFSDPIDNIKKQALYKFNDSENLPDDMKDAILG